MLRSFMKLILMTWFFYVLLLLGMILLGETAPENSEIAFFSQENTGTAYWRIDLFTGVIFKDAYSERFLVSVLNSLAFNPVPNIIAITDNNAENRLYNVDVDNHELNYIDSYTPGNHYLLLSRDSIFAIDYSNNVYNWTRINSADGQSEPFLEDFYLESPKVSPDGAWIGGMKGDNLLLINSHNASRYQLEGYCCMSWSPDSQWYIAMQSDNHESISVLSAATGEPHPVLPERFSAHDARWASDSQSIYFVEDSHLASISLVTGEIQRYPTSAENFWIPCLSPNGRYVISWDKSRLQLLNIETGEFLWRDESTISLINTETGEVLWHMEHEYSSLPTCFWSPSSRYLALYMSDEGVDTAGHHLVYWQRFVFIDTLLGIHWELYPENLPEQPIYLHVPE